MAKKKLITSTINHNVRVMLGLSCDEYVVMEVLHELYSEQPITLVARLMNRIGTTLAETVRILDSLQKKRMLYLNDNLMPMYIIDDRWLSCFDVNMDFEEFWQAYREIGNKVSAKKAYEKARVIAEKDVLMDAVKLYMAYCDETYSDRKFITKAENWLDTGKRRWEDKIVSAAEGSPEKKYEFL